MMVATSETIKLMREHVSVRKYTDEKIPDDVLREIIDAGRAAATWRNLQSYSIIVTEDQAIKDQIAEWVRMPYVSKCPVFLLFVGDVHRAGVAVEAAGGSIEASGVEPLLVTSVDAALAAQNIMLAAESLGYGGVFIGYVRNFAKQVSELFGLPDHTYPITGLCLGRPIKKVPPKERLPYETVVFKDKYGQIDLAALKEYDRTQADYLSSLGAPTGDAWTKVAVSQWGQPSPTSSTEGLKASGLI